MTNKPEITPQHVADAFAALDAEMASFRAELFAAFDCLQSDVDAIKDVIRNQPKP
jgi:hypothetical protein